MFFTFLSKLDITSLLYLGGMGMRTKIRVWGVLLALFAASLPFSQSASAAIAPTPFTCSSNGDPADYFHEVRGQIMTLDMNAGPKGVWKPLVNKKQTTYNAIGYNAADNFVYGMSTQKPTVGQLVRIGSNGAVKALGRPANLPLRGWISGATDASGNLWLTSANQSGNRIYPYLWRVNIETNRAAPFLIKNAKTGKPIQFLGDDVAFIDDALYALSGNYLYKIGLPSGLVTMTKISSLPGFHIATVNGKARKVTDQFGAAWVDNDGNLYYSRNDFGQIYQISDYTSGRPTVIKTSLVGPKTHNNDGANCYDGLTVVDPIDWPPIETTTSTSTSTTVEDPPSTTDTTYEQFSKGGGNFKRTTTTAKKLRKY
jgi:hypothetical protein